MTEKTDEFAREPGAPLDNPKREQFAREYIIDLNATKAYIRAGYSEKGARQGASRLLADVDIQDRISELKEASIKRVASALEMDLSADRILGEMASMAQADMADFFSLDLQGRPLLDLQKAQSLGLTRNIKKLKYKEMPAITVVEAGIELEREVFQVEIELWDKVRADENLMKHKNLLKERVEVQGLDKLVDALRQGRARAAAANKAILSGESDGDE